MDSQSGTTVSAVEVRAMFNAGRYEAVLQGMPDPAASLGSDCVPLFASAFTRVSDDWAEGLRRLSANRVANEASSPSNKFWADARDRLVQLAEKVRESSTNALAATKDDPKCLTLLYQMIGQSYALHAEFRPDVAAQELASSALIEGKRVADTFGPSASEWLSLALARSKFEYWVLRDGAAAIDTADAAWRAGNSSPQSDNADWRRLQGELLQLRDSMEPEGPAA